jgi:mannose-6-phosphate isomerase-like protein (cupin superfamily)
MELKLTDDSKAGVFSEVEAHLRAHQLSVATKDASRPWGGFFVIDNLHIKSFVDTFFKEFSLDQTVGSRRVSPKILVVHPGSRLSWQYHFRRAELWKVISGPVGVVTSDTDEELKMRTLVTGESIQLKQGERHRLVGLNNWGVLAEIWQHTNPDHLSDEEDIVRLQDDYGRGH